MMTQTTLNGVFCIRFVTGATRTTEAHVRAAYDIVCKEAETALETWGQTSKATVSLPVEPVSKQPLEQLPSYHLALVKTPRALA